MTELIFMLSVLFLVFAQEFVYAFLWFRGLTMKLNFSTLSATEGDFITLTEVVENAKFMPLPWLDVKFNMPGDLVFEGSNNTGSDSVGSELFSIGSYRRVTRTHKLICTNRGCYTVKGMTVSGRDFLMSRKYFMNFSCGQTLIIYPAALNYDPFSPAFRRITGCIRQRRFINPDPFEFRGIREYQPTDSLRSVNHRATAKTGELMVNVFEPTTSQHVTIWLNTEPYSSSALPLVYEMSIRLAATLAERFIDQGLTVELRTGAKNFLSQGDRVNVKGGAGKGHLLMILEALALIDLTQTPDSVADFLKTESDSVHILISAYDGDNLSAAAESLKNSGQDIIWILPRRNDARMRVCENDWRFYWEVS